MPRAVANDLPDWLEPYLSAVYADRLEAEMEGLNAPAPVDLRVNLLKTDRDGARKALAAENIRAEPTPWSPVGLRLTERAPLSSLAAFKEGLIEVQDEGSQLAALLLGAKPGMRGRRFLRRGRRQDACISRIHEEPRQTRRLRHGRLATRPLRSAAAPRWG